jgi:ADP-L-glycero-D-manno-heptose 6-epimerase
MIAVTGAAGFIGSHLAHRLAAAGQDVLLVDRTLTAAKSANLAGLPRFQFLGHDEFLEELELGTVEPEAILHLGACSSTTETNWSYLFRNNVQYSQRLWLWCARRGKAMIYASSAATYGDGSLGFDDHLSPEQLHPLNLYGKSKNDFDIWALSQAHADAPTPPHWAGVKFFNVYGQREQHKGRMASVVWQTYRQIQATGQMRLFRSTDSQYPDGGQLRDFVYVEDCVDHLLWLWRHRGANGLYNSGTGQARTFLDLARGVFAALELPPRIEYIPTPSDIARQYQNFTQAEMSKLHATGFHHAPTPLETGISRTIANYSLRAAA